MADKIYRFITLTYKTEYWQWSAKEQIRNMFQALKNDLFRRCYNKFYMGVELTEHGIVHGHLLVEVGNLSALKLWVKLWRKFGFVAIMEPRRLHACRDYCIKEKLEVLRTLYGILPSPEYINEDNIEFYSALVGPPGEDQKSIDQYFPK